MQLVYEKKRKWGKMSGVKGKTGIWKDSKLIAKRKKQLLKAGLNTRFAIGHKMSKDIREKIKKTLTGKKREKVYFGKDASNWKGENAGYTARHDRIRNLYGSPNFCQRCKIKTASRYEWSNNSGKYLEVRSDWERLCVKCHRLKDEWVEKVAKKNKGKKHRMEVKFLYV